MGTEVLRPQDCLTERFRVTPAVFPRRKFVYYGNPRSNRKQQQQQQQQQPVRQDRPDRQKRLGTTSQSEPSISKRSSSDDLKSTNNNNNNNNNHHPVIGQVTILRRGESLDSKIKSEALVKRKDGDDAVLILSGTQRLGPEPESESVPNQIRINDLKSFLSPVTFRSDMYAGSAFSVSPSPSSLPLPSFSKKKQVSLLTDDSATRDLRRLLRLD